MTLAVGSCRSIPRGFQCRSSTAIRYQRGQARTMTVCMLDAQGKTHALVQADPRPSFLLYEGFNTGIRECELRAAKQSSLISTRTTPLGNLLVVAKTQSLQSNRDKDVLQVRCGSDCGKSCCRL